MEKPKAKLKPKQSVESDKIVIFRTSRALRDKLMRKAAQDVIDGISVGIGAGAAYSVNRTATKMLASVLGVEFSRETKHADKTGKHVGMSFLFPIEIYEALRDKSERDGVSINEELQRILEMQTS